MPRAASWCWVKPRPDGPSASVLSRSCGGLCPGLDECGDAYRAGLLYGIAYGWDWNKTGRLASLLGSLKIAERGGQNHSFERDLIAARSRKVFGTAGSGSGNGAVAYVLGQVRQAALRHAGIAQPRRQAQVRLQRAHRFDGATGAFGIGAGASERAAGAGPPRSSPAWWPRPRGRAGSPAAASRCSRRSLAAVRRAQAGAGRDLGARAGGEDADVRHRRIAHRLRVERRIEGRHQPMVGHVAAEPRMSFSRMSSGLFAMFSPATTSTRRKGSSSGFAE